MKLLFWFVMGFCSTANDVKNRINAGLDKLFHIKNEKAVPYVCFVCDRFTGPDWKLKNVLELKKKGNSFRQLIVTLI